MNTRIFIAGLTMAALALGCSSKDDDPNATSGAVTDGDSGGADDGGTAAGDDAGDDGGTMGGDDGGTAGESDGAEDSADESGDDGPGSFLIQPDGGSGGVFECDLWAQDCPKGEKCIAWASDGGTWNATRCSEIADSPAQPGDECTVEGGGASGLDNCDIGGMCWDVDPKTNMGVCVAQCNGSAENPICDDPDTVCSIANNGALQICLPVCDPLLQDCSDSQACYPIGDDWACAPDVSGEMGTFPDPCEFINVCDPGFICAGDAAEGNGAAVCNPVCDTSMAVECPGQGQMCLAWYVEGEAPPGYEDVGVCTLPV